MRRLLTTMLAMTLLASGIAAAQEPTGSPPEPAGLLSGATVSCSLAAPSWVAGCWVERPVAVLGPVELAIGLDIQGDVGALLSGSLDGSHVAPYGILAYYGEASSVWVEVAMPAGTVPGLPLGRGDWLRVGFSHRIP